MHYNPYTETVEVIENKEQVTDIIAELKSQMDNLKDVVKNMSWIELDWMDVIGMEF